MKKFVFLPLVLLTLAIFALNSKSVFSEKTAADKDVYLPIIQKSFGTYWSKIYKGRWLKNATQIQDNNLIILSRYNNDFITKLTKNGTLLWEQSVPYNVTLKSVVEIDDGEIIVTGHTGRDNPNRSDPRLWVAKLSTNGAPIWQKEYHNLQYWSQANGLVETPNGNMIVVGECNNDHCLLKLDSEGAIIWQKILGYSTHYEELSRIVKTPDDNYLITGIAIPNDYDYPEIGAEPVVVILKINSQGDILWHKQIDIEEDLDFISDLEILSNGDSIYVSSTPNGSLQVFRLDSQGNLIWSKSYGWGRGGEIYAMTENSFYITGTRRYLGQVYEDHGFLLNIDGNGVPLWSKQYSPSDEKASSLYRILTINDEGILMTGSANYNASIWLLKTDLSGEMPDANCPIITSLTINAQESTPNFESVSQTPISSEIIVEDTSFVFSDSLFPQEELFCGE